MSKNLKRKLWSITSNFCIRTNAQKRVPTSIPNFVGTRFCAFAGADKTRYDGHKLNLKRIAGSLTLLASALLAGCNSAPLPNSDGPVLNGVVALPKSLATIYLSPTPDSPQLTATVPDLRPTGTPAPDTLTPTATVYVGIFMGKLTFPPGTVIYRGGSQRTPFAVAYAAPPINNPALPNANPPTNPPGNNLIPVPPVAGPPTNCSTPIAAAFSTAIQNPIVRQKLGCPKAPAFAAHLVVQTFQNGFMFWRDTKDIYALSMVAIKQNGTVDTFWRYPDNWNQTIPATDPTLVAPSGLMQPERGFGLVWRSNQQVKSALGWALAAEQPYDGTWQDFEHGWIMTGPNNSTFALAPSDGPPTTTGIHFGPLPQSGK